MVKWSPLISWNKFEQMQRINHQTYSLSLLLVMNTSSKDIDAPVVDDIVIQNRLRGNDHARLYFYLSLSLSIRIITVSWSWLMAWWNSWRKYSILLYYIPSPDMTNRDIDNTISIVNAAYVSMNNLTSVNNCFSDQWSSIS